MNPSIGRIVHYIADGPTDPTQHYAAVVTHVWSPTCVNLFVFPKGSPRDDSEAGVRTSVVYAEGNVGPSWHWPEREP